MSSTPELYVITGATGNIGSKVTEALLAKGKQVRVVARNAGKLKTFSDRGAEVVIADVAQSSELIRSFSGAKAVFAMIPPDYSASDMRASQTKVSESLSTALTQAGVKYVVSLSSLGAHLSERTGPILGLHDHEQRLNKLPGVNILHLRPTYFMENLLMNIGFIKSMNITGSPLRPDLSMPMIATKDIAAAVVDALLTLNFTGKSVRELLGPREYKMQDVVKVIGRSINKPDIPYVQFPYSEAETAMVKMGLSQDAASQLIEMNKSFNDGWIKPQEKRGPDNTTSTSIEEFAETVFAPAFSGTPSRAGV